LRNFPSLSNAFTALASIAALAGPLSSAFGCGFRVLYLKLQLQILDSDETSFQIPGVSEKYHSMDNVEDAAALVQLMNVTVRVPRSHRELVKGLSLTVPGNALLMGPSGCGKSSILRVIARLWPADGHMKAPKVGRAGLCFLSQRPYMSPGSLRQNIAYPSEDRITDDDVNRLLAMSGLSDLINRLTSFDEVLDWANILSLGEQQRVAFARCFRMMPSVAILDESTSALDSENETLLYQTLRFLQIRFVSVGHRSQLKAFHDQLVLFDELGRFKLSEIEAIPIPQIQDSLKSNARTTAGALSPAVTVAPEVNTFDLQPAPIYPLFRLCFLRRESSKNLVLHLMILVVFSIGCFIDIVWSKIAVVSGFPWNLNTSTNFILNYFLISMLAPAAVQTVTNALIAYSAVRTRKNLCRGMHDIYFSGNTYVQ
jgi:ABC-type iron transport system FetAB ATPase subunit